jgi:hypothetical protein
MTNIESFYKEAGIVLEACGARWKALCPFHTEKTPSFVVYDDGSYHCFGCSAHGTAKDIQDRFGLNYRPFPDLYSTKDPLIIKFSNLKSKMEDELNLLLIDVNSPVKYVAYDMFDRMILDAKALIDDLETNILDLVAFTKKRFIEIETYVCKKKKI